MKMREDLWKNIIFNEGTFENQPDGNVIPIFLNIKFQNEYGDTFIIQNLKSHKIFHQLVEKIQKDPITLIIN